MRIDVSECVYKLINLVSERERERGGVIYNCEESRDRISVVGTVTGKATDWTDRISNPGRMFPLLRTRPDPL